jgi:flagellar biosynthetic protein FliO
LTWERRRFIGAPQVPAFDCQAGKWPALRGAQANHLMQHNPQHRYPIRLALISAAVVLLLGFATSLKAAPAQPKTAQAKAPTTAAPVQTKALTTADAPSSTPAAVEPNPNDRTAAPSANDDRLDFMIHDEHGTNVEQPSSIGMMARALGALLLVIGLLVASAWCLRRLKGKTFSGSREDAQLTVLTTVSIGDKRSLTVVRFGERTLLLGSTQQSVTLLATDDDDSLPPVESPARSVAEVLSASEDDAPTQPPSFAAELDHQGQGQWRYQATEDRLDKESQVDNWR